MLEWLGSVVVNIFGGRAWLATLVVSMMPIVEVKGAIPLGVNVDFWGDGALTPTQAGICGLVGSCLVVPIIAITFTPILKWLLASKLFASIGSAFRDKVSQKANKIDNFASNGGGSKKTWTKCIGVFLLVALPLPLTGVWTGSCVGVVLGLKTWQTILVVVCGNIVASILVMTVCATIPQFTNWLLLIVLGVAVIVVVISLVKIIVNKTNNSPKKMG